MTLSIRLGYTFMVIAYSWKPMPVSAAIVPGNVRRGHWRTAKIA
jgi:hypothetical protein